jgi:hypothetical protein
MKARFSICFLAEALACILSALAIAATLVWPQWIEAVLGVDPDGGSGDSEWTITAGLCAFFAIMLLAARREWKRAAAADSPG